MHVVYSCVPGRFRGGIAKAVLELSLAQAKLGHNVEIFTTVYNSGERTDIPSGSVHHVDGVPIRYFDARPRLGYSSPALLAALEQAVDRIDVIHSHNTFLALNRYASRVASGRSLAFFHVHGALDPLVVRKGALRRTRKEIYIRLVERPNLGAASGIIALTDNEQRQLRGWGIAAPIHVVANGVELPPLSVGAAAEWRRRFNLTGGERMIAFIGRIVPKKAVHVLIEAFSRLHMEYPDCRLVIAGDRDQAPEYVAGLDRLARREGVVEKMIWPGFLDEAGKFGLLSAASVFSHVTESEGMAIAPLEAMAAGVPTIVSDACYMGMAAKAGAVLEVGCDAQALSDALRTLLNDPAMLARLGVAGAAYVAEHHAWPRIAKRLVDIYEASAAGGARCR